MIGAPFPSNTSASIESVGSTSGAGSGPSAFAIARASRAETVRSVPANPAGAWITGVESSRRIAKRARTTRGWRLGASCGAFGQLSPSTSSA